MSASVKAGVFVALAAVWVVAFRDPQLRSKWSTYILAVVVLFSVLATLEVANA